MITVAAPYVPGPYGTRYRPAVRFVQCPARCHGTVRPYPVAGLYGTRAAAAVPSWHAARAMIELPESDSVTGGPGRALPV
eukprot:342623-Hanusia_phi.AAC.1